MKLALTTIVAVLALFATPAIASAHSSNAWYWSESQADFKYQTRYDVQSVDCQGWGRTLNGKGRYFKHFDCNVWNWDGSTEEDELLVTSRRGFVVYD